MTFQEERSYIGHLNQLFGVKTYRLTGGRQEGVAAVDIATGAGLEFTVLADRCMDLFQLKLDGQNLNYFTPAGRWPRPTTTGTGTAGCGATRRASSTPAG